FMAKAHYFTYDDRNKWQPRVTFGEDFEGVLAHELSHYAEDMIAHEISVRKKPEWAEKSRKQFGDYAGPGVLFGNTGVPLDRVMESPHFEVTRAQLREDAPEALAIMEAVYKTPDYKRWTEKLE